MNAVVINQLTDEVVSGFYVFSTFVGDRVAGRCECPLVVRTQQNRRVHRHQAEECEQALQIDCFLCSQANETNSGSQELSATHPCFVDAQKTTLKKRLSLMQKPEVDLRSFLSVAQSESEKSKSSIFSERLYKRDRGSVPLRKRRRFFNAHQWALPGFDTNCAKL